MFGKLFTAFLVLLVLQGISGNQYGTQLEDTSQDLDANFEKIIKELNNSIENAFNTAFEQLHDMTDEIINTAKSIMNGIVHSFGNVIDPMFIQINELVAKADELQINVTECLGNNNDDLIAIPQQLFDNTLECVNSEVDKAKKISEVTKTEISKSLNIVDELLQEYKECSGITLPLCWGKVIANASAKIFSVPTDITRQVATATKLLVTDKINLGLCETKYFETARKDALKLSGEITKCIIDEIESVQ